tara:strand:- start:186 stop:332 length:147 start_codon:yes stop_codon:yes gene_type:complete
MAHIDDIIIEELEGVFKCDEDGMITDELFNKYDDLYKRVSRILKRRNK